MKKFYHVVILAALIFVAKTNYSQPLNSGTVKIEIKTDTVDSKVMVRSSTQLSINYNYFTYPDSALNNNIQGKVFFSLKINSACGIDSVKITKGLGYGLDETAVKILQNLLVVFMKDGHTITDCSMLETLYRKNKVSSSLNFEIK